MATCALANAPVLRDKRRVMVFFNGRFVPAEQAVVSAFDRGFLYGDGLFETLRVMNGVPLRWDAHWRRFALGLQRLDLTVPWLPEYLRANAANLSHHNQLPDALLRLTISRGVGERGYSPRGADAPTFIMSLHPAPVLTAEPKCVKLRTASLRLPVGDWLSGCKTANKLLQVVARAEAEAAGADEALLLNPRDEVTEATSANLFWIEGDTVHTTPLTTGALPGVTRADVLALCRALGVTANETVADLARLCRADGCFLTSSAVGVVAVTELDGAVMSSVPLFTRLHTALLASWREESA
ncbi:MAG: aminodeoxychorismate lyase [Proteobacteria bacterium]|nr:aminodeoxychorismate lyase [Pseudomonadota bacterium]